MAKKTDPLHVTEVISNLKSGVAALLGPRTLITGPNGSGKTSLLNSIELALTGACSDVGERDGLTRREADLLSLARNREPGLHSKVKLSDSSIATWSCGTAKGERTAKHMAVESVNSELVFPLRELRAELFGSNVENTRRFLMQKACGPLTVEEITDHIPAPLRARFNQFFERPHGEISPADRLLRTAAELAGAAREAAGNQRTADALAEAATPQRAPTQSEVDAATQALANAHQLLENAAKREALESGAGTRAKAEVDLAEATAFLADIDQWLTENPAAADDGMIQKVQDVLAYCISNPGVCATCGQDTDEPSLLNRASKLAEYAEMGAQARADREAVLSKRNLTLAKQKAAGYVLQSVKKVFPEELTGVSLEGARTSVADAEETLATVTSQRAAWLSARGAKDDAALAAEEVDTLGRLKDAVQETISKLLDQAVQGFCARVQKYLPPSDIFMLTMQDGDREVCQWGLMRDGVPHVNISGAEGIRVQMAMALAMSEGSNGLKIFVPDRDRAFDSGTLASIMSALAKAPFQVLLLATVEPTGTHPEWTIIRTARGDHQVLGVPEPLVAEVPVKAKRAAKGTAKKAVKAPAKEPVAGPPKVRSAALRVIMGD